MISTTLLDLEQKELDRQQHSLELIASENYVSPAVISAYSNVFTNKYSEGYPAARYYGGNEVVDELENYTKELALDIFGLNHEHRGVNVQPLSGSTANLAVYTGVLKAGDTILAMDLSAGGHLTHGMKLNASGKYFNFVHYGVDENGYLDYAQLEKLAFEHKPVMIVAGFSSYPRHIDWNRFASIRNSLRDSTGNDCFLMADISHIAGLIAGGQIPGPFECFDIVTTTTHKTLRGPRGALIYCKKDREFESISKTGKVTKSTLVDKINRGVFPGIQGGPFNHVMFAKAVAFEEILNDQLGRENYVNQTIKNSQTLANALMDLGRNLMTGGTDNHMLVMDVTKNHDKLTGLGGKKAEHILEEIGLSTNKNMIPNDPRTPMDPSGLRIGTPAITTRGLLEDDMKLLAQVINIALLNHDDDKSLASCKEIIKTICTNHPLPYGPREISMI